MAALTIAELRRAIAERLETIDGWWEAPTPYDVFGPGGVPDAAPATKVHAFAVGVPSTSDFGNRQRRVDGALARSQVRVRFLSRHTPGPTVGLQSQDTASDAEQTAIRTLLDSSWLGSREVAIVLTGATRSLPAPGNWFSHQIELDAYHRYSL